MGLSHDNVAIQEVNVAVGPDGAPGAMRAPTSNKVAFIMPDAVVSDVVASAEETSEPMGMDAVW